MMALERGIWQANQPDQLIKTLNVSLMVSIIDTDGNHLKNGKSMLDNLNSLRTILKGSLKCELIDLRELAVQAINDLSYMDNFEDIRFDNDIPNNFMVYSNLLIMNSVLINLIQNAIKYSNPKSKMNRPSVKINAFKIGKVAVIQVIDNGQGIKTEDQEKVFDLYFKNNNSDDGSGLGLYITKNAVERLGGEISLTSYPNKFTKFEIKIPTKTI